MIWVIATPLLALDAADLVRVEDPAFPGAIARSQTGATLLSRPPPGIHWRQEAVPVPDPIGADAIAGESQAVPVGNGIWAAGDGLTVTNADIWHTMGYTGQGVKVAVFDVGWYGGEEDLAELGAFTTRDCQISTSCEVPMDLQAPTFAFEEGHHGMACAETVRDMVPDADLYLVRVNSFTTLENAVQWAIREHIDVISMSLSYYNESFYDGSGPFAPLLGALEAADILLVSSAGNNASTHWTGPWIDADGDNRLDGTGDNTVIAYDTGQSPSFSMIWNQFGRCGETDLDLTIYDLEGRILGVGAEDQIGGADHCEPVEGVSASPSEDGFYRMEVTRRQGPVVGLRVDLLPKDMYVYDGVLGYSVADPGSNPLTFAVGAVRADGYLTNRVESFSSRGPTNAGVPKPDIAGPDGLSVSPYGPNGFYGTSASTPAVAGLVALVMSSDPALTPRAASRKLQGWAWGETPAFAAPDMALGPREGAPAGELARHPSVRAETLDHAGVPASGVVAPQAAASGGKMGTTLLSLAITVISMLGVLAFALVLIVVIFGSFVGILWVVKRVAAAQAAERARLLQIGIQAPALIVSVAQTGVFLNNDPQVSLSLQITPADAEPFTTPLRLFVSMVQIPMVQPGRTITVCYDPADRSKMIVASFG